MTTLVALTSHPGGGKIQPPSNILVSVKFGLNCHELLILSVMFLDEFHHRAGALLDRMVSSPDLKSKDGKLPTFTYYCTTNPHICQGKTA
jgi:hypothetical protein